MCNVRDFLQFYSVYVCADDVMLGIERMKRDENYFVIKLKVFTQTSLANDKERSLLYNFSNGIDACIGIK
jgi:hypothetical protein